MPKHVLELTYYSCDAPSDNPGKDLCPAESPGGYSAEDAEANMKAKGWVSKGRSRFCAQHAALAS